MTDTATRAKVVLRLTAQDILGTTDQFDATGKPLRWPIPNSIVHWAAVLKAPRPLAPQAGKYDLCCRTIDANNTAQPMPRPFPKSGHNAIQKVQIIVEE